MLHELLNDEIYVADSGDFVIHDYNTTEDVLKHLISEQEGDTFAERKVALQALLSMIDHE